MPISLSLIWYSLLGVLVWANYYKTSSVGCQLNMKMGGYILPKLNINGTPIANKYFEGKLKNTLVRG